MPDRTATLNEMSTLKADLDQRLSRIDEAHGTWEGAIGEWSVVHLLQHLSGWLSEMHAAVERMIAGQRPTPDGVDYSDPQDWNPKFVADRGEQTYEQALADFESAHESFLEVVGRVDAERFGDGKTINRMVEGVVTHHYAEHIEDLDGFLGAEH